MIARHAFIDVYLYVLPKIIMMQILTHGCPGIINVNQIL